MKHKILICDDDTGILEVSKIVLEEQGYEVLTAIDSDVIIESACNEQPNLILLDLWMPNIGGEKIIQLLKSQKETKDIPIIIVSASKDTEKIAKETQADGFINKPFDIFTLEDTVKKYIRE